MLAGGGDRQAPPTILVTEPSLPLFWPPGPVLCKPCGDLAPTLALYSSRGSRGTLLNIFLDDGLTWATLVASLLAPFRWRPAQEAG
jgi:hypothetical protein